MKVASEMSPLRETLFLLVVVCGQLVTQVGLGEGLSAIEVVGRWFHIDVADQRSPLGWSLASYSLTAGTFILIAGRLGDMYGNKRMFMFGYGWLALWSLIAGFSRYERNSPIFFYVCRGFQGIGPAFLLPNGLALLGRLYTPGKRKTFAFAEFGACTPLGFVLGATFAALFAQLVTWAWVYWVTAIFCCLLVGLTIVVIPEEDQTDTNSAKVSSGQKFDILGAFTGVAGLMLFNVSWNQAPIVGWSTPYVYILLIIGVLLMVAFVMIELKGANPLIPLADMSGSTARTLVCVVCGFGTFGIWVYYYWLFLLTARGNTPLLAAAQFSPVAISGLCAAGVTGLLFSRGIPTPVLMVIALIAFCVPSVLLATVKVEQIYWASTFVGVLIAPFGVDVCFPAATLMVSNAVSHEYQGMSASLIATVVNYSISIGLGIAGTAVSNSSLVTTADGLEATVNSIRVAAYVGIGLSGFGILTALYDVFVECRQTVFTRGEVEGDSDKTVAVASVAV
jgi:MFS family permease